jgi:hypothetical protein
VLILTAAAAAPVAAGVLWIICGVLADKAADAEWRSIDRAHFATGRDVLDALSRELRAREARLITRRGS